MKVLEIKDKEKLDRFLIKENQSFLQNFEWGEFQKKVGRKIWRFGICLGQENENNFQASALVIKHDLPFGKSYLYCPRGPAVANLQFTTLPESKQGYNLQKIFEDLLLKLEKIAQEENAIFLRIDPEWRIESSEDKINLLTDLGFVKSKKEIQPKDTLVLDISKTEEEILKQMHQKTRYNIRLSKRVGVKIRKCQPGSENFEQDFNTFWKLVEETSKRNKFRPHPKEYYRKMLEVLKDQVLMFVAEINLHHLKPIKNLSGPKPGFQTQQAEEIAEIDQKLQVIAAIIVSFFGQKATYLHGASDYEYRSLMAPHLLQWVAIKEAKERQCQYYDFWGIARQFSNKSQGAKIKSRSSHPWTGITRFKKGFGEGEEKSYIGAWDFIFQPFWYKMYDVVSNIKG